MRAQDDQWFTICQQAHRRGMMKPVPPRDIFRGVDGEMVLSGAGGIPKEKCGSIMQRFISIFCPINEYLLRVPGAEAELPYVGQVCLLQIGPQEDVLRESRDL